MKYERSATFHSQKNMYDWNIYELEIDGEDNFLAKQEFSMFSSTTTLSNVYIFQLSIRSVPFERNEGTDYNFLYCGNSQFSNIQES